VKGRPGILPGHRDVQDTVVQSRTMDTSRAELEPDVISNGNPFRRPGQQSRQPVTLVDPEY